MVGKESKKDEILKSALELFTTRGFDNTSTTLITKNAGVGTGTLFTYFENKVELINTLYMEIKKELSKTLEPLIDFEVINEDTKASMRKILKAVQDGSFARDWILENQAGRPVLNASRKEQAELQIEKVGKQLREMMSWIKI